MLVVSIEILIGWARADKKGACSLNCLWPWRCHLLGSRCEADGCLCCPLKTTALDYHQPTTLYFMFLYLVISTFAFLFVFVYIYEAGSCQLKHTGLPPAHHFVFVHFYLSISVFVFLCICICVFVKVMFASALHSPWIPLNSHTPHEHPTPTCSIHIYIRTGPANVNKVAGLNLILLHQSIVIAT